MANSVDPEQTAPIRAVCSGSMLFAFILNLSVMLDNYLQQTTYSDAFFLGTLRANHAFGCRLLNLFKIIFSEKLFQEHYQSVKPFGFRSGPTVCPS